MSKNTLLGWVKGYHFNVFFAALLGILFTMPDYLYKQFDSTYLAAYDRQVISGLFVLTLFALFAPGTRWLNGLTLFIALLQLGQLMHVAYCGALISPHSVLLLFTDFDEIVESVTGSQYRLVWPVVLVSTTYLVVFWLINKADRFRSNIPGAQLLLVLTLLIGPEKAYNESGSQSFYPNPRHLSIKNTYYAVSYFLGRDLPRRPGGEVAETFKPYAVKETAFAGPMNVVIIVGESMSPAHMSVFGYGRETTSRLQALADAGELLAKEAISGGVSTKVAVPTFFNLKREPKNISHLLSHATKLISMAEQRGFTTHYISAQKANLATYIGDGAIDHFSSKRDFTSAIDEKFDLVLVDGLVLLDFSQHNFIVLHQRGSHSSYHKFHPDSFDHYPENVSSNAMRRVNAYDNNG